MSAAAGPGGAVGPTLPDYLRGGLRVVSVGLNPSLPSVRAGYYFANPRNRFWRALAGSGLGGPGIEPGREAVERLFRERGMGFTDAVKRATANGSELRAPDYRAGCRQLRDKLLRVRPAVVWFHGMQAYRAYRRHADGVREGPLAWGAQTALVGSSRVFVTPNPSPANAAYSLADLVAWYRALGEFVDSVAPSTPGSPP